MWIAIRDDDVSYFTDPEVLREVWGSVSFPVTLGVTPFMVEVRPHAIPGREFPFAELGEDEFPIRRNDPLVRYLRSEVAAGRYSLALHGCNHRYRVLNGRLVAEFATRGREALRDAAARAKAEVEALFDCSIDLFIPPDNAISRDGMLALAALGIRYVQRTFPLREIGRPTRAWMTHYLRRAAWRLRHGSVYSAPFDNGVVVEAPAYLFKPTRDLATISREIEPFVAAGLPLVLATHHWELREPTARSKFAAVLDSLASRPGVQFVPLRAIYP